MWSCRIFWKIVSWLFWLVWKQRVSVLLIMERGTYVKLMIISKITYYNRDLWSSEIGRTEELHKFFTGLKWKYYIFHKLLCTLQIGNPFTKTRRPRSVGHQVHVIYSRWSERVIRRHRGQGMRIAAILVQKTSRSLLRVKRSHNVPDHVFSLGFCSYRQTLLFFTRT